MPRDKTRIEAGDQFTRIGWGDRLFTCTKREGKMIYAAGYEKPFPTTDCIAKVSNHSLTIKQQL